MITPAEIRELSGVFGLRPEVVEKDYVLGWLLAGIYQHPELARSWVFKGGTCLKKCYFETYRFSEDLDFTISEPAHLDNGFLMRVFADISRWVYEASGVEIPAEQLRFEVYENYRKKPAGEGRVYYRGPVAPGGALPKIKLDLTGDELLATAPASRPVAHPYSDVPAGGIHANCYAFDEIFGEKIRALGERARPRDLYDVINLFRNGEFHPSASTVKNILRRKCDFKNVPVTALDRLQAFKEELFTDWSTMLGHQLPALPPVESFWDALPEFFAWLEQPETTPLAPPPGIEGEGETIHMPTASLEGVRDYRHSLELIRFCGANRLCVEIDYQGKARQIEPYSLRRAKTGNILLHAIQSDDNGHRSFKIHEIRSARATQVTFIPRYTIELTPSGYQPIPPTERPAAVRAGWNLRPVHVYQCTRCGREFRHATRDSKLRAHKNEAGYDCSGRTGRWIGQE